MSKQSDYYDSILGPQIIEPDEVGTVTRVGEDSILIDRSDFWARQAREEFFNSPEFKQAEKERIESSKPKEHETVGFARVYCPEHDKIRPEWLCVNEHDGDIDLILDEKWEE